VKSPEQQLALMLRRTCDLLIRQRTMLANAFRANLSEFGIIAAKSMASLAKLAAIAEDDEDLRIPQLARFRQGSPASNERSMHGIGPTKPAVDWKRFLALEQSPPARLPPQSRIRRCSRRADILPRGSVSCHEQQIKRGAHRSIAELEAVIQEYIDRRNADPKPFRWTKTADDILAAVERFCRRTSPSTASRRIIRVARAAFRPLQTSSGTRGVDHRWGLSVRTGRVPRRMTGRRQQTELFHHTQIFSRGAVLHDQAISDRLRLALEGKVGEREINQRDHDDHDGLDSCRRRTIGCVHAIGDVCVASDDDHQSDEPGHETVSRPCFRHEMSLLFCPPVEAPSRKCGVAADRPVRPTSVFIRQRSKPS
jgi:hypothetical protein